ncbi:O-antigen ligase family protein [Streptomyces sp. NBC_00237]|nr:O-antigen ligase family protein [Streptomyces sp. NBC_00237]
MKRPTTVASHLCTATLWAVLLSPAFFATVVWARVFGATGTPSATWGETRSEIVIEPWRLYAGSGYAAVVLALLLATLVVSFAATRPTGPRPGTALLVCALLMYAGPVLSGVLGEHGGAGDWRLWLAPLLLTAFHLAPRTDLATLVRLLRAALRVFTYGSLLALALAPTWAVVASKVVNFRLDLVLPGGRLAGLTNHPNALGAVVVAALLLECQSVARTRLWPLHAAVAGTTLLFAQSRTAWLAALVGLLFLRKASEMGEAGRSVGAGVDRSRVHPVITRGIPVGLALCAALFVPSVLKEFEDVASSDEVSTLHGRHLPWEAALGAFRESPWLGWGPGLFSDPLSPVHRAFDHAHNQLLHTLGTAGLLGAAGLLLFVAAAGWASARTSRVSGGLGWALTAATLMVCVPEAPLRGNGFTPYLVLTLVLFGVLSTAAAERAAGGSAGTVGPAAPPPSAVRVPRPAAAPESSAPAADSTR